MSRPPKRPQDPVEGSQSVNKSCLQVAKAKAEAFERDLRNSAEKRICEEFFKAFPDDNAAALEAYDCNIYDAAVDAEMRQQGAGVAIMIRAAKKALARKA